MGDRARAPAVLVLVLFGVLLTLSLVPGAAAVPGPFAARSPPVAGHSVTTAAAPDGPSPTTGWDPSSGRPSPGAPRDSLRTIPLAASACGGYGNLPAWLAFDAADASFWVATSNDCVEVVHSTGTFSLNITASYPVGSEPFGVAVDNATGEVYVSNTGSDNVTVLDGQTGLTVANIAVGSSPYGVTYDPASGDVFVANGGSDNVSVISGATRTVVGSVAVGTSPVGLVADPLTEQLFVADNGSSSLTVVSILNRVVVTTLPVGAHPFGVALDNATDQVYVTNAGSRNLSVVDAWNDSVAASIPVANGVTLEGIAYDPLRQLMWAGGGSFYAVLVNTTSQSVLGYLATDPSGVAVDPSTGVACLTNTANNTLSCFQFPGPVFPSVRLTFTESGLPALRNWTLTLHWPGYYASQLTTPSSSLEFLVFAGDPATYYYAVATTPGYVAVNPGGSLLVGSTPGIAVNITFVPTSTTYPVRFNETGLPSGTTWSVSLGGAVNRSSGTTIGFQEPNGTYSFTVAPPSGYAPTPSLGSVLVAGASVGAVVAFTLLPPPAPNATATFHEQGLPPGAGWEVGVGTTIRYAASAWLNFSLAPGTSYAYYVYPVPGYLPSPSASGTFRLPSGGITIEIPFVPVYAITFQERGLPAGANWSVTVDGRLESGTTSAIGAAFPAGVHIYRVGAVPGYDAVPSNGSLNLTANTTVAIVFSTASGPTYAVEFAESGLVAGTPWCVALNGTDLCTSGASATITLVNGTYNFTVRSVPGYTPEPAGGTVLVQGAAVERTITFWIVPSSSNAPANAIAPTTLLLLAVIAVIAGSAAGLIAGILVARRRPPPTG